MNQQRPASTDQTGVMPAPARLVSSTAAAAVGAPPEYYSVAPESAPSTSRSDVSGLAEHHLEQLQPLLTASNRLESWRLRGHEIISRCTVVMSYCVSVSINSPPVQAIIGASLPDQVGTQLEAVHQVKQRLAAWQLGISRRFWSIDSVGYLLILLAMTRGTRTAFIAVAVAVAARIGSHKAADGTVWATVLGAAAANGTLVLLNRLFGTSFVRVANGVAILAAVCSKTDPSSLAARIAADLQYLVMLHSDCSVRAAATESQPVVESFGVLHLAISHNPCVEHNLTDKPLRHWIAPVTKWSSVYHLGAYDRWLCINTSCVRVVLLTLKGLSRVSGAMQRGSAMWHRAW